MSREIRYFGPHREPAVLVEDFGELKAGMVVWNAPCRWCEQPHHRIIVMSFMGATTLLQPDGERIVSRAFEALPVPRCRRGFGAVTVSEASISRRIVWRVIDEPPAKAKSRTRGRTLENA